MGGDTSAFVSQEKALRSAPGGYPESRSKDDPKRVVELSQDSPAEGQQTEQPYRRFEDRSTAIDSLTDVLKTHISNV